MNINMIYPIYIGRNGSMCYFTYDKDFFNEQRQKCIELVSFYTLYLFGHKDNQDDVIVKTKNHLKTITLKRCLKLLYRGELHHRIFHLSKDHDQKLMALFEGNELFTNEFIKDPEMPSCKTPRKHQEYPCMFDEFMVQVYESKHVFHSQYGGSFDYEYIVGEQISEWQEEHDDEDCLLCDGYWKIRFCKKRISPITNSPAR